MRPLLRFFFDNLYHSFAGFYDLVAAAVSLGRWRQWVRTPLPFVRGPRVLELAFGTGMLQQSLLEDEGHMVAGIDESAKMVALARRRLKRAGLRAGNLIRGRVERLPFADGLFDSVVSTFPNEFIVDSDSLAEVRRLLRPGGRLIVVPVAWIVGRGIMDRAAAWLFRATRQAPDLEAEAAAQRFVAPLEQAGFKPTHHKVDLETSTVLVVIGSK